MFGIGRRTSSFVVAAILCAVSHSDAGAREKATASQREAALRFERAQAIVRNVAADAERLRLHAGWESATLSSLLARPSAELAAIAGTTQYATLFDRAKASPKALGDPSTDLVFRPVTPCRIIDTRFVGGKITGARSYDTSTMPCGLSGFADGAIAALVINVTVVDTSAQAPGFLTIRPEGATGTSALLNWFISSPTAQISNAAIVPIDQGAPANDLEIVTSSAVDVIVDLFGLFLSPGATPLQCETPRNPMGAAADLAPGAKAVYGANCSAGYVLTGGGCQYFTSPDGNAPTADDNKVLLHRSYQPIDLAGVPENRWVCHWTNNDTITWRVQTRARCCRVPGN